MQITGTTQSFLQQLDAFSGNTLTRRDDLGVLLELSRLNHRTKDLARLSFLAKFLSRAHGIMTRIGPRDEAYGRIAGEFSTNMEEAQGITRTLLQGASRQERGTFETRYLAMTPDGLENFLALLHDLAWYKNWLLDHEGENR